MVTLATTFFRKESVITSYSIHYTKLYDAAGRGARPRPGGLGPDILVERGDRVGRRRVELVGGVRAQVRGVHRGGRSLRVGDDQAGERSDREGA